MNGTANTLKTQKGHVLYNAVKAGFTLHGTDFATWCRNNRVLPANARQALLGTWSGPKAQNLVKKIIVDSQATDLLLIKKDNKNV